jgi:hypothetical protein
MLAGGAWQQLPNLSAASALLLPSSASLRLIAGSQLGAATLTFEGWNQTQGSAGALFNIAANGTGGLTAFSVATTMASIPVVNHAPTLANPNVKLPAINENANSPAVTATTLLSKAGYTDADGKSLPAGIAITGDSGPGAWQWLNGSTWTALPAVSSSAAFLLPGGTQVRFQPADSQASNTNATATLTYLGWDETAGAADALFALPTLGGSSAFSSASTTVSMPINFVKPAPVWLSGASANFTPVLGFSASDPIGDSVADVFGSAFRDAPGISVGVAIMAPAASPFGVWQYYANGTWNNFSPKLSTHTPLLLQSSDLIRFMPTKNFSGVVTLNAYAWDGAAGFSAAPLVASCLVNSAPTLI